MKSIVDFAAKPEYNESSRTEIDMSDVLELKYRAGHVLLAVDTFLADAKAVLADKNFFLEARWELYLKIEKLLPIDTYLSHSLDALTDSPYDDVFQSGRGFKYNSDIDEMLVENYDPENYDPTDKYKAKAKELFDKRDAWREAVLAEGIGGMAFDW